MALGGRHPATEPGQQKRVPSQAGRRIEDRPDAVAPDTDGPGEGLVPAGAFSESVAERAIDGVDRDRPWGTGCEVAEFECAIPEPQAEGAGRRGTQDQAETSSQSDLGWVPGGDHDE